MPDTEQHELPPVSASDDDKPYTIFDARQRALIVFLVSVAASCTCLSRHLFLVPESP